jgi:hypothetical protein
VKVEVETGAFDIKDGAVRRQQRRWECDSGFSALCLRLRLAVRGA